MQPVTSSRSYPRRMKQKNRQSTLLVPNENAKHAN